jgi:inhibitor of KinA sporulation pathway (predicted exonuclease)
MSKRHYLVVDLEATCDDRGAVPRSETEIIEVGGVLVDGSDLTRKAEFQTFVRPVRHPGSTMPATSLGCFHSPSVGRPFQRPQLGGGGSDLDAARLIT